jgi:bifunctional DNA-binding transcriptional regulator/antitoxin component of YhaV-PrlF toxin-antitoxin module
MDKELLDKLNYKEGDTVLVLNPPEGYLDRLGELAVDTAPQISEYSFIQVFLYKKKEIPAHFEEGVKNLQKGGKLWFCYAKRGSELKSDITRDNGWNAAETHGFVAVRQVAIDNTWSALRFKPAEEVKNMQRQNARREFKAEIIKAGEDTAAGYIKIPYDIEKAYGTKGQVKVKATFDGYEYRGSIANMGAGHILIVRKDVREAIGKDIGDTVSVVIEKDVEPRTIEIPDVLQQALNQNPFCKEFYNSLSFSNRKEYANWIGSAKRAETQQKRLEKTIEKLKAGIKNPHQK